MLEQYFIAEYKSVKPFFGQFALRYTCAVKTLPRPLTHRVAHHHPMSFNLLPSAQDWRQAHLGRLLGHAMRRFDERVLQLMAQHIEVPLALANLAARDKVSAAHIHITRHLPLEGARLNDLAAMAAMSKQAMGDLVTQCEAAPNASCSPTPVWLGCAVSSKRWRKPKPSFGRRWARMWPPLSAWVWRPMPMAIVNPQMPNHSA